MTVAELIAALRKLNPKHNVYAGVEPRDESREVIGAEEDYDIACNDRVCRYVFLQLGEKP